MKFLSSPPILPPLRVRALVFSLGLTLAAIASAQPPRAPVPQTPPPRNAEGHVILGSVPGKVGAWEGFGTRPMLTFFDQEPEGSLVSITPYAQVLKMKDIFPKTKLSEVPFQPWARALFEARSRTRFEPYTRCKPSPGPRAVATAYGTQFVEFPDRNKIYIFPVGGPRHYREIWMDGRPHPEHPKPSYHGHSIGHWEGDTLVVDSVGFNEKMWFDAEGSPHTNQLHLVERFTRMSQQRLKYEVTIDDPGAYTKPWSSGFYMDWTDGESFQFVCQDDNQASELMVGTKYDSMDRQLDKFTATFDPARIEQVQGTVVRVDWANPHTHLFLRVKEGNTLRPWYVELESPQLLELNGWNEQTLKPGDKVDVSGQRARDGTRQLWGISVKRAGNSQALFTTTKYPDLLSSIAARAAQPTPRWPDKTPMLSAPAGHSGYWVPTRTTLMEDGVKVEMAANGQLNNLNDAARVAPLQPWALALYQNRQRNFLRSDPTLLLCRPPSGPRNFLNPYGIQLLEDKALQRVFVINGDGNNDWYLVYTDGRKLDSEAFQLDVGNLLYNGRNSAHWEGDSFVIESEGYNERFWLPGGLPHSEHMHVTEKLTRTDYNTLAMELTINDPATYTRPWKASWTLKWLEGQDPPEHYCQDNRL